MFVSQFTAHHFAPESNEDQQSSNMIEYVEEEYIDDMNDEDTNDGFEHVDIAVKDEPETFDALSQSLETNEQEGNKYSCELWLNFFDFIIPTWFAL